MKNLREYQIKAIEKARIAFSKNMKKIMIWLATGGGKSVIFGQLAHNLVFKGKKRLIFIVRRRQLIFQAFNHLVNWGLNCSMLMAGEKIDENAQVQVCSIDTVISRMESGNVDFLKNYDAVIVDECHDCTSTSYIKFFEFIGLDKIYIGLTATPFEVGNKVHSFWETCIKPIEVHELKDMGFLTDARVFMSHIIDTSGFKKQSTGDYKTEDTFRAMAEKRVVGDVVDEYKRLGQNKPAILFAVNLDHSKMMAEAFNEAGIPAIHCDQSTPQKERDNAISKLANGEIKILCNVNIFSTGVDIPQAEVGIMARPTASEILYIQQLGRLLRPYKICKKCKTERGAEDNCHVCGSTELSYKKEQAIILDHGENTARFGLPFDIREAILTEADLQAKKSKIPKESDGIKVIKVRECKSCFASNPLRADYCLYCNEPLSSATREIKTTDGQLLEVTEDGLKEFQKRNAKQVFNQLKALQLQHDRKEFWIYFQMAKKFKKDKWLVEPYVPKWWFKKLIRGEIQI